MWKRVLRPSTRGSQRSRGAQEVQRAVAASWSLFWLEALSVPARSRLNAVALIQRAEAAASMADNEQIRRRHRPGK